MFRPEGLAFRPGETWFTGAGWGVHQSWLMSGDYEPGMRRTEMLALARVV